MDLSQALQWVGEQHQAQAADRSVEAALGHFQLFTIDHLHVHVGQPGAACVFAGKFKDGWRDIGGQHAARAADAPRHILRLVSGAGGDIQNAVA
jgi:hypothetical protein